MRISYGNDALIQIGTAIRDVIPEAAIESSGSAETFYRVRVYSETPVTLRQLKAIEAIISHDRIDLVPATYEYPLSDVTPGAGFARGFVSFEWSVPTKTTCRRCYGDGFAECRCEPAGDA